MAVVDDGNAERGLAELLALYRDAQRIIAAQVREAIMDQRIAQRAFRVEAYNVVVAELERLGVRSEPMSRRLIENAWNEGDASITRILAKSGDQMTFNRINREALGEMQQALGATLGDARKSVGRHVFDVYRRAGLQSTTLGLIGARGSGRAVSQDLIERLQARGVKSFTDSLGRSWDLRRYAEMVARTTTREAVVAAQVSRMVSQGIDLARVSRSSKPCSICAQWQGQLVSLTGVTMDYEGEPVTTLGDLPAGGPPFHPNCRHYLTPEATEISEFMRESEINREKSLRRPDGSSDDPRIGLAEINEGLTLSRDTVHGGQLYSVRRLGSELNSRLWNDVPLEKSHRVLRDALEDAFDQVARTTETMVLWRAELRGADYQYAPGEWLPRFKGYMSTTADRAVAEAMLDQALAGNQVAGDLWRIVVLPGARPIDINRVFGAAVEKEQEVLLPTGQSMLVSEEASPRAGGGRLVTVVVWRK